MIREIGRENEAVFFRCLGETPFFAALMRTLYASSGGKGVRFYLADGQAALQVSGTHGLLVGRPRDGEELASFLSFQNVTCLKSDGYCPQGFSAAALPLMRYDPAEAPLLPPLPTDMAEDDMPSMLRLLAELDRLGDGAVMPDTFAVDACARRNRGLADIRALTAPDGRYAATAGVYALQPWEAYLAAVKTAPAFRGRGCAGYLVARLAQAYADRPVRLLCAGEMTTFYTKLGFAREGSVKQCNLVKE